MNTTQIIFLGIIIIIILAVVITFFIFRFVKLFSKPKVCVVCNTKTEDSYRNEKGVIFRFCRNHLIEKWKNDFMESKQRMIVIEPDFIRYPYGYLYATIETLGEWEYPKEDQDVLSEIMKTIEGKHCKECNEEASVAYFKKEDYIIPYFSKITATPIYFCRNCVARRIKPIIESSPKPFTEDLYAPTNEEGVYHVQEF